MPILAATLTAALTAQRVTLLSDVNPGLASSTRTDQFVRPHPTAGFGLVQLDDGVHGSELWRTDGTAGGTRLLFDHAPGLASARIARFSMAVSEEIWFADVTPQPFGPAPSLWRTDGSSPAPTRILDGAQLGIRDFGYGGAAVDGDGLVFVSTGQFAAWELWRVDSQGDHRVLWTAGARPTTGAAPFVAGATNGSVAFTDSRNDLYVTDGTAPGTVRVASGPDYTYHGHALGGFLVVEAVTLPGPVPGTRVTVVRPGSPTLSFSWPTRRLLAYGLGDELWVLVDDRDLLVVDPSGTTTRIATFVPDRDPTRSRNLFGVVHAADTTLFFADDGSGAGRELWRSDGTAAGTGMVADLQPGPADLPVDAVLQVANRMVFWVTLPGLGSEPWSTDGTLAGTYLLGDMEPGAGSSSPASMYWPTANSALLAIHTSAHGLEPWFCDGTPQGTRLAADIRPGPGSSIVIDPFSALFFGSVVADRAVFPADDGIHGVEFWTVQLPTYLMPHADAECSRDPDLELEGWPRLGGGIELTMSRLAPSDRGAVVASLPGRVALTTVEGCGVYVDPSTAVTAGLVVPNANGSWSTPLAVPNLTSLIGAQLTLQSAMVDSAAPNGWRPGKPWRVTFGR